MRDWAFASVTLRWPRPRGNRLLAARALVREALRVGVAESKNERALLPTIC